MKLYPIVRDLWGQVRGYRRWSIRRAVKQTMHMSSAEVAARSHQLARERYWDAIQQFPSYAALVREQTGQQDIENVVFEKLPILSKSDITRILGKREKSESRSSLSKASASSSPRLTSHVSRLTLHFMLSPFRAFRVFRGSKIIRHSTGGSTGQPFSFYITRESYEWRTAVSDRGYAWAQAEEGQRSFYVWGTSIRKPGWKQQVKERIHHWLQNRYYFDSFHFDDAQKKRCCESISRFKPVSLVGYAGNLIELGRYVERNPGALRWRARTCVTAAEGLRPGMRELIEAHLADEVFMSYGSREFMLIGMEGPDHDGYLLAADNLYVEVVDDEGLPCGPGESGRIVVTDLHNEATPFVRYAIGDIGRVESRKSKVEISQKEHREPQRRVDSGQWRVESGEGNLLSENRDPAISNQQPVTCNPATLSPSTVHSPRLPISAFPKLAAVEGRLQEVIVRADGETLTALFVPHLMKEFVWVDGYQFVQETAGRITVNVVTRDADWEEKAGEIERLLREKLGEDMRIELQRVERLEKTPSGKTPIVLNRR